jgi:hypothetical protein
MGEFIKWLCVAVLGFLFLGTGAGICLAVDLIAAAVIYRYKPEWFD